MEPCTRRYLEPVRQAHVIGFANAVGHDVERSRAPKELLVLEAAHSDLVLAGGDVRGDVDVVVTHCETTTKSGRGGAISR